MAATAKLMAWLGLDATNFKSNIDAATSKLSSMEVSMRNLRTIARTAFALGMLTEVVNTYKELKDYQEKTGVKIMSNDDMKALDATAEGLKKIKMQLTAFVAVPISRFLQGWKAAWAGLGAAMSGGDVRQSMAAALDEESVEDITQATARLAKAKEAHTEKMMNDEQKLSDRIEKRAAVERQLATNEVMKQKGGKGMFSQSEEMDAKTKSLELSDEILDLEKKVKDEKHAQAKKLEDAEKQYKEAVAERRAKLDEMNEASMTNEEKLLHYEQERKDLQDELTKINAQFGFHSIESEKQKLKVIEKQYDIQKLSKQMEDEKAKTQEKMNELLTDRQEMERQITQLAMSSEDKRKAKAADYKKMQDDLATIIKQYGKDSIKAEEQRLKITKADLEAAKNKAKAEEIRKRGAKDIKDLMGGKGVSPGAFGVGGGLQSVGGYFATQGAVKASEGSRAIRVQEEIKRINEQMARDIANIADPDGVNA